MGMERPLPPALCQGTGDLTTDCRQCKGWCNVAVNRRLWPNCGFLFIDGLRYIGKILRKRYRMHEMRAD